MAPRRRSTGILVGVGLALIAAAAVWGVLIAAGIVAEPNAFDSWWSTIATAMRSPATVTIALGLNLLGRGIVATLVVPAVLVLVLLVARRPGSAVTLVAALALTWGATRVLKSVVARDRPEDMLVESDFGSFPSGHASNAAAVATVFFLLIRSAWIRIVAVVYVLAMMWSRTLLGAHWATDVVAGVLVGTGVAIVVVTLAAPLVRREPLGRRSRG
ncbi:undecaprenyl-diphosphatase [Labedella gwakjiensis]|uniref:Phosphatase PAP2 family protein n=1 Tax=Labedella gwakjiensis TaxID=390269 RepID=A0A2P8GXG4_9MICO|nr:phosphatase PAP2 family protein [Labedella gwakjiensis]PSL38644.1 undecaprenyl-diphosphatase [Labedella gwakjiensis]RUQ86858.1 phosphatase PAP2 family protein [Labedella gwakjiensis]